MDRETQIKKIENYINAHTWISQREAWLMGIGRLASRIHDMKEKKDEKGKHKYHIVTEYRIVRNRDGSQSRVAFYGLGGEEE